MFDSSPPGIKVMGNGPYSAWNQTWRPYGSLSVRAQRPSEALAATRDAVKAVRAHLAKTDTDADVAASHTTLSHEFQDGSGRSITAGYTARVSFSVHLSAIDRLEELLVGIVESGADEIDGLDFRQPLASRSFGSRLGVAHWRRDARRLRTTPVTPA